MGSEPTLSDRMSAGGPARKRCRRYRLVHFFGHGRGSRVPAAPRARRRLGRRAADGPARPRLRTGPGRAAHVLRHVRGTPARERARARARGAAVRAARGRARVRRGRPPGAGAQASRGGRASRGPAARSAGADLRRAGATGHGIAARSPAPAPRARRRAQDRRAAGGRGADAGPQRLRRRRTPLRPRLHVVPRARLRQGAAPAAAARSRTTSGSWPRTRPLHDEAVCRAGGTPGGVSSEAAGRAAARTSAPTRAAAALARACWPSIEQQPPGHARRRRQRVPARPPRRGAPHPLGSSASSRGVFPPGAAGALPRPSSAGSSRSPARRATSTSTCSTSTSSRASPSRARDLEPLRGRRSPSSAGARARRMVRALRSARARRAARGLGGVPRRRLADSPRTTGRDAARPDRRLVAAERIGTRLPAHAQARRQRRSTTRPARGAARPAQEGQGAALPARVLRRAVSRTASSSRWCATLKALQDTLGRFQDREVQAALAARRSATRSRRARAAPAALMAMGVLVERLDARPGAARAEFAERFAAFAAPRRSARSCERPSDEPRRSPPTTSRAASGRRRRR